VAPPLLLLSPLPPQPANTNIDASIKNIQIAETIFFFMAFLLLMGEMMVLLFRGLNREFVETRNETLF
jgi:hypothetical protein